MLRDALARPGVGDPAAYAALRAEEMPQYARDLMLRVALAWVAVGLAAAAVTGLSLTGRAGVVLSVAPVLTLAVGLLTARWWCPPAGRPARAAAHLVRRGRWRRLPARCLTSEVFADAGLHRVVASRLTGAEHARVLRLVLAGGFTGTAGQLVSCSRAMLVPVPR